MSRPAALTPEAMVAQLLLSTRAGGGNWAAAYGAYLDRFQGDGVRPLTPEEDAWVASIIAADHRWFLGWLHHLETLTGADLGGLAAAIWDLGPAATFSTYATHARAEREKAERGPTAGQRSRQHREAEVGRRVDALVAQGAPLHDNRHRDGALTMASEEFGLSARQIERLRAPWAGLFREQALNGAPAGHGWPVSGWPAD